MARYPSTAFSFGPGAVTPAVKVLVVSNVVLFVLNLIVGDVMTLPGAPNQMFSIGDIVIGLGIVDICFEASRVPRRRGPRLANTGNDVAGS